MPHYKTVSFRRFPSTLLFSYRKAAADSIVERDFPLFQSWSPTVTSLLKQVDISMGNGQHQTSAARLFTVLFTKQDEFRLKDIVPHVKPFLGTAKFYALKIGAGSVSPMASFRLVVHVLAKPGCRLIGPAEQDILAAPLPVQPGQAEPVCCKAVFKRVDQELAAGQVSPEALTADTAFLAATIHLFSHLQNARLQLG